MVEQAAVNGKVSGSSPEPGAILKQNKKSIVEEAARGWAASLV
jgi:hypothetical protein